ncbi:MAG: hypothetical protein E6K18_01745 [Methanobacteriota archaeon]|nr:MAG: hypothetical protein E6K18_01745 [Euryarchaeota archaeon]
MRVVPRVSPFLLLALMALSVLASPPARAGDAQTVFHTTGLGDVSFPPANLSHEDNATNLGQWLAGALGTDPGAPGFLDSSSVGFIDGYNRSFEFFVNTHAFSSASGSVIRTHYATPSLEFISFEAAFTAPRPMSKNTLLEEAQSVAASLGLPLANATYSEYSSPYPQVGTNGSLDTLRFGFFKETRGVSEVNFANQLRLVEDVALHALVEIRSFRWLTNLTSPSWPPARIVDSASRIVNETFGETGTLTTSLVGIAPNFRNLTVSILVRVGYTRSDDTTAAYDLFLDSETLQFQYLVSRLVLGPSNGSRGIPLPVGLSLGALAVAGGFLVLVGIIWWTQIDAGWALAVLYALVPLYLRIKKESVLDHFLRGRIVEFLSHNQGSSFSSIRARFDVANGTLTYHLWVLTKTGFIRASPLGGSTRYYTSDSRTDVPILLSGFQQSLLQLLGRRAGAEQRELVDELHVSKQRINYNVRFLARMGLVDIRAENHRKLVVLTGAGIKLLPSENPPNAGDSARDPGVQFGN